MSTDKPRVLDLFCCAGGATKGYQDAGFHVVGVDKDARPDYCGDEFHQGDAVDFAWEHAEEFDLVHASPPCQTFSTITPAHRRGNHLNLIPPTRAALIMSGVPFVIENVMPTVKAGELRMDVKLCGEMFGLKVIRHRAFELGRWTMEQPKHLKHRGLTKGAGRPARGRSKEERLADKTWYYYGVYGWGDGPVVNVVADWQMAMGIDWMTDRHDLAEALPPAYTELLGREFLNS